MNPARAAAIAALCACLSACAAQPPAPASTQALTPPREIVDGTYRGSSTRFQAGSRSCPRPGLITIQVWDGQFQYRWDRNTYIDVTIRPDGTVQGQGPGITLAGRRDGQKIEGDVTNGTCGLHFTVTLRDR